MAWAECLFKLTFPIALIGYYLFFYKEEKEVGFWILFVAYIMAKLAFALKGV